MNAITAVVRNGRLETIERVNFPDGTDVRLWIEPIRRNTEEMPPTAEEIAQTLAAMDQVQPFVLTAEEIEACESRSRADKGWEHDNFELHGEHLRQIWE